VKGFLKKTFRDVKPGVRRYTCGGYLPASRQGLLSPAH